MKPNLPRPKAEDVLNAFAVESDTGPETLTRYIERYPYLAADLEALARELAQPHTEMTGPLSQQDQAHIDAAWKRYVEAAPTVCADPFAALSVSGLREVAKALGVRSLVLTAFRERMVIAQSVPGPFLVRLASAMGTTANNLKQYLALGPIPRTAWSNKADQKPSASKAITFEQLLIEAGTPEQDRAKLMAED